MVPSNTPPLLVRVCEMVIRPMLVLEIDLPKICHPKIYKALGRNRISQLVELKFFLKR